jgi:hypothetical protein
MKRVMTYDWLKNENGDYEKVEIGEALFHQWGVDYEEFESGPGNFSVAIVEYNDGSIKMIYPPYIKFLPPVPGKDS